jgi:hypothetical protein
MIFSSYLSRCPWLFIWALSLALLAGCVCRDQAGTASTEATTQEFEQLYAAWHKECGTIQYSSNVHDYIVLPSYRRMVGLGRPALPFLQRKMSEDADGDFMLAYAVVEICGWDQLDFKSGSEQEFRDQVLQKLKDNH